MLPKSNEHFRTSFTGDKEDKSLNVTYPPKLNEWYTPIFKNIPAPRFSQGPG